MVRRINAFVSSLIFVMCAAAVLPAQAQSNYPNRPIRVIVPWPPGQATDIAARVVAHEMSKTIGQPMVIDNRAGAGGGLGTDLVAKAAPDGYTMLAASAGPVTINPLVQKTAYTPERDFTPVHMIAYSPYVLVTNPSFPATNAREFVAHVRANPDKYSFSSSGTGATAHLVTELFNSIAGLKATHIPYKGSAPAMTDLLNGQIAYTIETMAATSGHIKAGRLRAYGISTLRRSATLPEVPTLADAADMPAFDATAWLGWFVPAGTPRDIVMRLSAETERALQSSELRDRYLVVGLEMESRKPDDFAAYLKTQSLRFGEIVKRANIRVD